MRKEKIKAIIFDMDGVLFLSSPAHAKAYKAVLKPLGIKNFDYRKVAGMNSADSLKKLNQIHALRLNKIQLAVLKRKKSRIVFGFLSKHPKFAVGLKSTINRIAKKYPMALVSSGSRKNVNLFLRKSGLKLKFKFSLSGDDVKQAKPHPKIYMNALKKLKIKSKEALVVEDSWAGVRSARRAGISVVGMTGTLSREKLKKAGAFAVVTRLSALNRYV